MSTDTSNDNVAPPDVPAALSLWTNKGPQRPQLHDAPQPLRAVTPKFCSLGNILVKVPIPLGPS